MLNIVDPRLLTNGFCCIILRSVDFVLGWNTCRSVCFFWGLHLCFVGRVREAFTNLTSLRYDPAKDSTECSAYKVSLPSGWWENKLFPALCELWELLDLLTSKFSQFWGISPHVCTDQYLTTLKGMSLQICRAFSQCTSLLLTLCSTNSIFLEFQFHLRDLQAVWVIFICAAA